MDPFTIATLVGKIAPSVIGWFGGDDAEEKAQKVADVAMKLTGTDDPKTALDAIQQDPALALEFERAVMQTQLEHEREKTKRIEAVNQTMREEAKSEHWAQWMWRPFNGFAFGLTLFLNYGFPPIINMFIAAFGEATTKHLVAGTIPEWVFMAWASVLGVTAWHRGVQKREAEGGASKALAASPVGAIQGVVDRVLSK